MIIKLVNLKNGDVSLDLFINKDTAPIRVKVPQGGYANVGDLVSLDELNQSDDLKTLVANSDIRIVVEGETDDLAEVVAATLFTNVYFGATETQGMGIAPKSGTIKSVKTAMREVAASGESVTVDVLKNGTTVLTGVITVDDSVAARTAVEGVLDAAEIQVVAGDFFEVVFTYTAGGGPTPILTGTAEVVINPA